MKILVILDMFLRTTKSKEDAKKNIFIVNYYEESNGL